MLCTTFALLLPHHHQYRCQLLHVTNAAPGIQRLRADAANWMVERLGYV